MLLTRHITAVGDVVCDIGEQLNGTALAVDDTPYRVTWYDRDDNVRYERTSAHLLDQHVTDGRTETRPQTTGRSDIADIVSITDNRPSGGIDGDEQRHPVGVTQQL